MPWAVDERRREVYCLTAAMNMSWVDRNISAVHLFFSGLLLVPAFLLQGELTLKGGQTLFFVALCLCAGRRVRPTLSLLILMGIAAFHLLTPTGRVLSMITPDAQRTMFTFLGASSEMRPREISGADFDNAAIVFIEGYLLFNRDLLLAALEAGKKSGALVALDLASFTVVEESMDILDQIVSDYVDILIANEDEARAYTGYRDERKGIEALSRDVDVAVLKVGEKGSYISQAGKIIAIAPKGHGSALDTTGAGDLWASGFLFGLLNGYPIEKCGELGSACGYEVCQVMGAHIPEEGWNRIKRILD